MQLTRLGHEQDIDSTIIDRAVEVLMPRWGLSQPVAEVTLSDLAEDLGVEVLALAALVVRASFMPRRRRE